tara:strand:+ start:2706 stop:3377 length:672 start_codon:yes stop_codon:yes gene_type:complete
MNRIIKLSFPYKEKTKVSISKIINSDNIYKTIDFFTYKIFLKNKLKYKKIKQKNNIKLKNIINLHNIDGLDLKKIKSMFSQLKTGKPVLSNSGLPNVKLAKLDNNYVLFDGHHTILAYMLANKEYLNQIPYLIVSENITDNTIKQFFIEHSNKLKNKNWRNYVVNWQVQKNKQLCGKIQKNIGELFESINEPDLRPELIKKVKEIDKQKSIKVKDFIKRYTKK